MRSFGGNGIKYPFTAAAEDFIIGGEILVVYRQCGDRTIVSAFQRSRDLHRVFRAREAGGGQFDVLHNRHGQLEVA